MYIQEKCGDKMENQLNMRNNEIVKKRALIFSGILLSLLILVTSTASACTYAYVPNVNLAFEGLHLMVVLFMTV
jgi:hypothetical protein